MNMVLVAFCCKTEICGGVAGFTGRTTLFSCRLAAKKMKAYIAHVPKISKVVYTVKMAWLEGLFNSWE